MELLKSLAGIEHWDFSDRRGTLRIPCHIEGRLEAGSGPAVDVDVVDIGLRGLQLMIRGKVRKGSVVELSSRKGRGAPVKCRIEWKKKCPDGFVSGVSFKDDEEALSRSWLFAELKAIGVEAVKTEQRRCGVRVIAMTPSRLKMNGEFREALLVDLGLGGALIEVEGEPLKVEDEVRLEFGPLDDLDRVAVNSRVVVVYKREPYRYGIKFETFFLGGVTDLERYLTYFYALSKA